MLCCCICDQIEVSSLNEDIERQTVTDASNDTDVNKSIRSKELQSPNLESMNAKIDSESVEVEETKIVAGKTVPDETNLNVDKSLLPSSQDQLSENSSKQIVQKTNCIYQPDQHATTIININSLCNTPAAAADMNYFHSDGHTVLELYRESITNEMNHTIMAKINRLKLNKTEIYINRRIQYEGHCSKLDDKMELLNKELIEWESGKAKGFQIPRKYPERPYPIILINGEAGSGKSSFAAKTIQRWEAGKILSDFLCILFLAAGSEERIALQKMVWGDFGEISSWTLTKTENAYRLLTKLAADHKLAIIIDGLDEFGDILRKDVRDAATVAKDPTKEISLKTTVAGLLSEKILSGAIVAGLGRNIEHIKNELLDKKGACYQIVDFSKKDRIQMVEKMELDKNERTRVLVFISQTRQMSLFYDDH